PDAPAPHPLPALFPYTTLFRSNLRHAPNHHVFDGIRVDRRAPNELAQRLREQLLRMNPAERPLASLAAPAGRTHRVDDVCGSHEDRKSTRLNSSHVKISYAVFC